MIPNLDSRREQGQAFAARRHNPLRRIRSKIAGAINLRLFAGLGIALLCRSGYFDSITIISNLYSKPPSGTNSYNESAAGNAIQGEISVSFEGNRKGRATWWSMQESRRSWFSLAKSAAANQVSAAAVPRMLKSNTGRIKSVNSGNS